MKKSTVITAAVLLTSAFFTIGCSNQKTMSDMDMKQTPMMEEKNEMKDHSTMDKADDSMMMDKTMNDNKMMDHKMKDDKTTM